MIDETTYDYLTTQGDQLHQRFMHFSLKEEELEIEIDFLEWKKLLTDIQHYVSVMNKHYEDIKRKLGQLEHLKQHGNNEHGMYNYHGDIVADLAECQEIYNALSMRKIEIDDCYITVYNRATYKSDGSERFNIE
tara:strand:- start:4893 stop:5294 length:402 start_codon:yes stop_codon:yes gene_type:complete